MSIEINKKFYEYPVFYVILIFAIHILLNFSVSYPIPSIFADEMGYILNARLLANHVTNAHMMYTAYYYPGYSFFLAPIMFLVNDPTWQYYSGVLLNSFFLSLVVYINYQLLLMLDFEKKIAIRASFIAGLYPAFLIQSNFLWSESYDIFIFSLYVMSLFRCYRNNSLINLLTFFIVSFLLLTAHGRFLLAYILGYSFISIRLFFNKKYVYIVFALFTGLITLYLTNILHGYFQEAIYMGRSSSYITMLVKKFFTINGFIGFINVLTHQIFYLIISTFFLLLVSFAYIVKQLKNKIEYSLLILLFSSIIFSSALFMTGFTRYDHLYYGRYNEAGLYIFLSIGICYLSLIKAKEVINILLISLLLVFVLLVFGTYEHLPSNDITIIGLKSISYLLSNMFGKNIDINMIFIAAMTVFLVLLLNKYIPKELLLITFFLLFAFQFQTRWVKATHRHGHNILLIQTNSIDWSKIKSVGINRNGYTPSKRQYYSLFYFLQNVNFRYITLENVSELKKFDLILTEPENIPNGFKFFKRINGINFLRNSQNR